MIFSQKNLKTPCDWFHSYLVFLFPTIISDAPRAQRGASRYLNLIIYELCRFIPAYKAGLSRHLPVNRIWVYNIFRHFFLDKIQEASSIFHPKSHILLHSVRDSALTAELCFSPSYLLWLFFVFLVTHFFLT